MKCEAWIQEAQLTGVSSSLAGLVGQRMTSRTVRVYDANIGVTERCFLFVPRWPHGFGSCEEITMTAGRVKTLFITASFILLILTRYAVAPWIWCQMGSRSDVPKSANASYRARSVQRDKEGKYPRRVAIHLGSKRARVNTWKRWLQFLGEGRAELTSAARFPQFGQARI